MKKSVLLFVISIALLACDKEFIEENQNEAHNALEILIGSKKVNDGDTVYLKTGVATIFKAVSISGDNYAPPAVFYWEFGDGSNVKYGQQVDHKYEEDGIYTVVATVTDANILDNVTVIIVAESDQNEIPFKLHTSYPPNNEGKIKYVLSGAKEYIPDLISENGPFAYQGSNPESTWNIIQIEEDTSSSRIYWETTVYNSVHSQMYGAYNNGTYVWADMESSYYYSSSDGYLKVALFDGEMYKDTDHGSYGSSGPGSSGDFVYETPEIRFEVREDDNEIDVYVDMMHYSQNINKPKARFKIEKSDPWSSQQDTQWLGGTGFIRYVVPINDIGEYHLRIEPNENLIGIFSQMDGSYFYDQERNCFRWLLLQTKDAQNKRFVIKSYK
jgi:PKD repeat protein